MWHILQAAIIVWLCVAFKSSIAPDRSMGHIFLFSVLVAYAVTWLISRAIDLVRTNSRTCFLISLLITAAVIVWWITSLARPLDAPGFAIMGAIGFCIFVPSMWAVSKGILLVRRLQGHPPPPRPARPPVTVALVALVEQWRTPLSYCIFVLLFALFLSLTFHAFDLWLGRFPGEAQGRLVGVSLSIVLIGPAIATRAIIQWFVQWLLRSGSAAQTPTSARPFDNEASRATVRGAGGLILHF